MTSLRSRVRSAFKSWEFWVVVTGSTAVIELWKWHWWAGLPAAGLCFLVIELLAPATDVPHREQRESDPSDAARLTALNELTNDRRAGLVTESEFDARLSKILHSGDRPGPS